MGHRSEGIEASAMLALVTGGSGMIEAQEARGQSALVSKFDTLPGKGLHHARPVLEALGFVVGEVFDDLFYKVTHPPGWGLRATDHSMWNDIVDDQGRKRGSLFYKAAFYDRDAHFSLSNRYYIDSEYDRGKDPVYEKRERVVWKDRDGRTVPKPAKIIGSAYDGGLHYLDATGDIVRGAIRQERETYDVKVEDGTPWENQKNRCVVRDRAYPDAPPLFEGEWRLNGDRESPESRQACLEWLQTNFPEYDSVSAYWDDAPAPAP